MCCSVSPSAHGHVARGIGLAEKVGSHTFGLCFFCGNKALGREVNEHPIHCLHAAFLANLHRRVNLMHFSLSDQIAGCMGCDENL